MMKPQKIKFVTDAIRFENVQLDPKKSTSSEDAHFKYGLTVAIEKTNLKEIERINKVVESIMKEISLDNKVGLIEGGDSNFLYLNVVSKDRPGIVDANLNPIIDVSEIYNGCIGRVSVTAFTYHSSGRLGVAFGLNSIQKLGDK